MNFYCLLEIYLTKKVLDTAAKTGLDALKTFPVKAVHIAPKETGEFVGNKITHKIVKPKDICNENLRDVERIIVKIEEILKELRQA